MSTRTYECTYVCIYGYIFIHTYVNMHYFTISIPLQITLPVRPQSVTCMSVLLRSSNRMYSAHLPPRSIILFKNCTALSLKIHDEIKSSYHNVKRNKRYQVRGKWPFSLFQLYRMLIMD